MHHVALLLALSPHAPLAGEPAATGAASAEAAEADAWAALDAEIAGLAAAVTLPRRERLQVGADMISTVQLSEDEIYAGPGEDLAGFELRRIRLTGEGTVGDVDLKISGDLAGGEMELKDAYGDWNFSDTCGLRFGRYKQPILWSGFSSTFYELFFDQPATGAQVDERQAGAAVFGALGPWSAILSAQNGVDGQSDELLLVARLQYDLLGENAFGTYHGAYGYPEDAQLSLAVSAADDGAIDDGSMTAFEAAFLAGGFSLRGDTVAYADDYDVSTGVDPDELLGTPREGTNPWSATTTFLIADSRWELLARFEDFDDGDDTRRTSLGVVYYTPFGPDSRLALIYQDFSSDLDDFEGDRIELGFAMKAGG